MTLQDLHAIAQGPNRCDTITPEHWLFIVDTLPIRTGHDQAIKGDDDGYLATLHANEWHGGYTDYKDHRNDTAESLRSLARLTNSERLNHLPQYVSFFRGGIPQAFRITGYMGGISITTEKA